MVATAGTMGRRVTSTPAFFVAPRLTKLARQRRERLKPDWAPKFFKKLSQGRSVKDACAAAKVSRQAIYQRRDSDDEFASALRAAIEDGCDDLETEARRRAVDGLVRKKFHQGVPVIDPATRRQYVEREYSDTLLLALLRAHWPERYGTQTVEHKHGGTVTLQIVEEIVSAGDPG
jgi:hypothetical protein